MAELRVGTSGWSYRDWENGVFYPPEVKSAGFLEYYASQFDCTELNFSFYRVPSEEMVEGWFNRTPTHFRFCPKMSRFITHRKRLTDVREPLGLFVERFKPLKERLGPFLVQVPGNMKYDAATAERFYQLLEASGPDCRFALEPRHESWFCKDALDNLRRHGIAFVIADSGGHFPEHEAVTTDLVYLRFHGPEGLYSSDYPLDRLAVNARRIEAWMGQGLNVWAFFNNDAFGYAVKNARQLRDLVMGKRGRKRGASARE